MLFTGISSHAIDAKQRLAIPAKYRNQWDHARDGSAWYCLPWPTGHLRLYTERTFVEFSSQRPRSLTPGPEDAELDATLFGLAERLEMDGTGRIAVPKAHLEIAGLASDVVVVGAGSRLEVHDATRWKATFADRLRRLPELIEGPRTAPPERDRR